MRFPIQLQCIFSYTILANPDVEQHAPNTYSTFYNYPVAWVQEGRVQQNLCLRLAASQTRALDPK